ncbi:MAG: hypothetical protein FWE57_11970 [Chitinispirillia bacterium]|nr:hypothetical protein [Chitinispirillia bacterium]
MINTTLARLFGKKSLLVFCALATLPIANVFAGPVEEHGRLVRVGSKLVGEKSGKTVQLKGPSMQWSTRDWGSDRFFVREAVDAMVDGWNAQIIRGSLRRVQLTAR